jgi:hypothetical protein
MKIKNEQKGKPGRKPGTDNKVPLTIYLPESGIKKAGDGWLTIGKDRIREVVLRAANEYIQTLNS